MAAPPVYRQPLDGTELVRVLKDGRFYMAPISGVLDLLALPAALAPILARLAILEARPEEVAHFTAAAKFPTIALGASFTLTLTGLTPARVGDVLKAGEQVEAWPTGTVPAGVALGRPTVIADGVVAIPCSAGLAIAASSTPVPFALAALR